MTTVITRVIDPGGTGDFLSLAAWQAAMVTDLVAADQISIAECRCTNGMPDTSALSINGWTTDATHYIQIYTDPTLGYRHNGTYQTGNIYRLELQGYGVDISTTTRTDIYITGIEFSVQNAVADYSYFIAVTASAVALYLDSCIFVGPNSSVYQFSGVTISGTLPSVVVNSIIQNIGGVATSYGLYINGPISVYNTTIITTPSISVGLYVDSSGVCAAKNCYGTYGGGGSLTLTTCASPDASGSVGLQNIPLNITNFKDDRNNFLIPITSALRGVGTNLYNDSTWAFYSDIIGVFRGLQGVFWDIGASEYQVPISLSTSTWTGTQSFYGTIDGTNWFPIYGHLLDLVGTGSAVLSTSTNGVFRFHTMGLLAIKVQFSTYVSGAARALFLTTPNTANISTFISGSQTYITPQQPTSFELLKYDTSASPSAGVVKDSFQIPDPWYTRGYYYIGDTCTFQGQVYQCILAHSAATAGQIPTNATYWQVDQRQTKSLVTNLYSSPPNASRVRIELDLDAYQYRLIESQMMNQQIQIQNDMIFQDYEETISQDSGCQYGKKFSLGQSSASYYTFTEIR